MRYYKTILQTHKPTGITQVIYAEPDASKAQIERLTTFSGEPRHIVMQGRIAKDKKYRRRGIWQQDKDDPKQIFFTCPWCGSIGTSTTTVVGTPYAESIFCMRGCRRHLTLFYRKTGEGREGLDMEYG